MLPIGMEQQLPLLDNSMQSNFGPLLPHCPVKTAETGVGDIIECPLPEDEEKKNLNDIDKNKKEKKKKSNSGTDKKTIDFNGNKVPHPLPIQNAKLPRGAKNDYPKGDYPGGDPNEEEHQKQMERKDRMKKNKQQKKKGGSDSDTESQPAKYKPTWGPVPVHVNGGRGGSDYLVDPDTGKTYNLDHGEVPADKLRTSNPKTYQARVENGWDPDTAR